MTLGAQGRGGARRAVSLLLAAALAACQRDHTPPEVHAARTAVVRYNQALVQAYRAGRAEALAGVASPAEVRRVAGIVEGLSGLGKYMEAQQTDFRVLGTTINDRPDGVTIVDALETWSYEHRDLAARERPVTPKTATYRLAYNLVRAGDGFQVHQVIEHELPPGTPGRQP